MTDIKIQLKRLIVEWKTRDFLFFDANEIARAIAESDKERKS